MVVRSTAFQAHVPGLFLHNWSLPQRPSQKAVVAKPGSLIISPRSAGKSIGKLFVGGKTAPIHLGSPFTVGGTKDCDVILFPPDTRPALVTINPGKIEYSYLSPSYSTEPVLLTLEAIKYGQNKDEYVLKVTPGSEQAKVYLHDHGVTLGSPEAFCLRTEDLKLSLHKVQNRWSADYLYTVDVQIILDNSFPWAHAALAKELTPRPAEFFGRPRVSRLF